MGEASGYRRIGFEDRLVIQKMCRENATFTEIGKVLGVAGTTVSREVNRQECKKKYYDAEKAQALADKNKVEQREKINIIIRNNRNIWRDNEIRKSNKIIDNISNELINSIKDLIKSDAREVEKIYQIKKLIDSRKKELDEANRRIDYCRKGRYEGEETTEE